MLEVKDQKYPYLFSFSFDHRKSLFSGGENTIENLAIICHKCNIIKGTMDESTYRKILRYLPHDLQLKMFEANWGSKIANKLEREDKLTFEYKMWQLSSDEWHCTGSYFGWIPLFCPECGKKINAYSHPSEMKMLSGKLFSDVAYCLFCKTEYKLEPIGKAELEKEIQKKYIEEVKKAYANTKTA